METWILLTARITTDQIEAFAQHPWTLMVMGWIGWYIIKAGVYYKERHRLDRTIKFWPTFKEWFRRMPWNIIFTMFCSYFIIVWDDEIIEHYFTGNWERFSDIVYILSGPVSSTLWYVAANWDGVVERLVSFLFGKYLKK